MAKLAVWIALVTLVIGMAAAAVAIAAESASPEGPLPSGVLLLIGKPDGRAAEFGLTGPGEGYTAYLQRFASPVVYIVGRSCPSQWPYIHPAPKDRWAGGKVHPFTIRFQLPHQQATPLFLVIGLAGGAPSERSQIVVSVNGKDLPAQQAPSGDPRVCFRPATSGKPQTMIFPIAPGLLAKGENTISIRLEQESWIIYDYVALSSENKPLALSLFTERNLLAEFRKGPMAGVDEIIFAARRLGEDPHWYANFGTTLERSGWATYGHGARLCRLDLRTGRLTVLLEDREGGIRDPVVNYDGRQILFSYRRGTSPHYLLYVIHADGSGLRQLTDGPYDDIEPIWLPDGGILFVSSRCNRCVNCHTTRVAVLYRCDADGSNIRMLSSNNEHDNTPWLLPSGQILYTRWEYVDRNQLSYHHLWITSPDGTRQTVFYGNQQAGTTMIDAKPVPGSRKVAASFSPGHGQREHAGVITLVDPRLGPDDPSGARAISQSADYRDPWPFSENASMAAQGGEIVLMDGEGNTQIIYRLGEADLRSGLQCHEPRPLAPRPREPVVADGTDWTCEAGRVVLADVYHGRNMQGVRRGEIKKLLVMETLPKPMNYTGGMEPLSYGGTFTLERVLGTVPVEPDGSAYAELPALRSLFFVALDENDLSVKRMQSFMTVLPGETTSCVGCHEHRTLTPASHTGDLMALRRPPSKIELVAGVADVLDFPRDIQPILDRHCLRCHDCDNRQGGVVLSGDRGPIFSLSYYTLTARNLVVDGRNGPGNRPPRSIGSSASRLMQLMDSRHYGVKLSARERTAVRLWIDSGAPYPGTYAALGTGMIGGFEIVDRSIRLDRSDTQWPAMRASMDALTRRCARCHAEERPLPLSPSHLVGPGGWGSAFRGQPPWVDLTPRDVRRRWARDLMYDLTRPAKSLLLLAPLAKSAGGCQACGTAVFADTLDEDYQKVLRAIRQSRDKLEEIKRFDMPGFRPRTEYVREMQRFGILPVDLRPDGPIDVYDTDRRYWQSLWYRTAGSGSRVSLGN